MKLKNKFKIIFVFAFLAIVAGEGSLLFADYLGKRLPSPPKECFTKENEYDKWICFRPYFTELVNKVSPAYAMTQAKILKDKRVIDDCHLNAHFIGEAALEKYDFDAGKAFAAGEFGCIEGYFHGVMERYVRYESDPSTVASNVKDMCVSVTSPNPQLKALLKSQCAHGVGHGLAAHGFLPPAEALVACNHIDYAHRCKGGVAMEHVEQYLSLPENKLKEALPKICEPFEESGTSGAGGGCIHNLGVALMWYTKHDLQLSQELCEELEKPEYIYACKRGTEDEDLINLQD